MPRAFVLFVLCAFLIPLAPAAWALDPLGLQDDASSGADAPDDSGSALVVAEGEHVGALDGTLDRVDWFTTVVGPTQKMRIDVAATSGTLWFRVLDGSGDQVYQTMSSGSARRYVGAVGVAHRFELDPGAQSVEGSTYWFRITLLETIPQDDAGTGGDAPISHHLRAGTYTGTLHPASFDLDDWYVISKPWGAWVNVTMTGEAGKSTTVDLYGANWPIASQTSSGDPVHFSTGADVRSLRVRTSEGGPTTNYSLTFSWYVPGPAPPVDDAGMGIDAPGGWTDLPFLAEGTYEGRLDLVRGDEEDHFAFYSPPGRYLQVTFETIAGTGPANVAVHVDELTTEASQGLSAGQSVTFDAGSGIRILRLAKQPPNCGSYGCPYVQPTEALYRITTRIVERPDVAVTDLSVAEPVGPTSLHRIVRAEVENPSGRAATTTVTIYVVDATGSPTALSTQTITLAPYSTRQVSAEWTPATYVGEFTIGARAQYALDPNAANDVREVRASGTIDPGLGVGVGASVL